MDLYVIRHGIAELRSLHRADQARALTPEGLLRLQQAVRGMARLGVTIDRVLHSPWRRAVETAEALTPLGVRELVVTDALADDPSEALLAEIRAHGQHVGVVGHQPWLSELVAWLVFGDPQLGGGMPLKKAGVAWLRGPVRPGGMVLAGLWAPKHLRAAAGGKR